MSQDDCLSDVVEKLLGHKLSSLPVVDSNGHATDVITKADLAMALMEVNGPQVSVVIDCDFCSLTNSDLAPLRFPSIQAGCVLTTLVVKFQEKILDLFSNW